MRLVSSPDITSAVSRLAGRIVRTPLVESPRLGDSLGLRVLLKAENLQHTGSFKVRGVLNALLARRARGELPAGVATFSAGNHAAATAFGGRALGLPVVVCMPPGAVVTKVEAVRRYGGEIIFTDDLLGTCQSVARERGYAILHPFDDPDVIAGQATVGAELLHQAAEVTPPVDELPPAEPAREPAPVDVVLVPVGGGGLISGVAAAVRAASPSTRVVGVEPVTANAMTYALRLGTPTPLPQRPVSLADGLAAPFAGVHTLAHVRELVDEVVEVPEEAIRPAWWELLDSGKLLVEPSAAVGLAALRHGLVRTRPGETVALVLSGGNVAPASLAGLG
ncbi:threonine dehydratase [Micromonospora pisi]|uniref:Threonine dehydratase n=1 Tax=Micromonospora pisi TaxID=589240 RepID=A0A495JE89_9ACTN|nr:pyridoxal-phosphate dependent enzyme [Micromonospora pisi]RKR87320.1 threonine dehydratase [Micromonospora pisi]